MDTKDIPFSFGYSFYVVFIERAGFFNPALKKLFKNSDNYNHDSHKCKKNLKNLHFYV